MLTNLGRTLLLIFLICHFPYIHQNNPKGSYQFEMFVNRNGSLEVNVSLFLSSPKGSAWILIPKNNRVKIEIIKGRLIKNSTLKALTPEGYEYVFYKNFSFTYSSNIGNFEMSLRYNFTNAAFIIEPEGYFLSPQIGCPSYVKVSVRVYMPRDFHIEDIKTFSSMPYSIKARISMENSLQVILLETASLDRVIIGFRVERSPDYIYLVNKPFTVKIVRRYLEIGKKILELYKKAYPLYTDLFGVSLENVTVEFFLPSTISSPLNVGGYVPFNPTKGLGSINLNIIYTRTVEGFLEIISLHELTHHFIWKVGVPPDILWAHEGLANYVAFEIAEKLGYQEAADQFSNELINVAKRIKNGFGFLQSWSLGSSGDVVHYAAAYYIFWELGNKYGGLEYYKTVFRLIKEEEVADEKDLINCLSEAAGQDLIAQFKEWGFKTGKIEPKIIIWNPLIPESMKKFFISTMEDINENISKGDLVKALIDLALVMTMIFIFYVFPLIAILALIILFLKIFIDIGEHVGEKGSISCWRRNG